MKQIYMHQAECWGQVHSETHKTAWADPFLLNMYQNWGAVV